METSTVDCSTLQNTAPLSVAIPAAQAWHLLAKRFLGQEISTHDRDVLTTHALYGPWLATISAQPNNIAALRAWCGDTKQPPGLLQHLIDMVKFEKKRQRQIQKWEDEAERPEGNSPRRIAGCILFHQAEKHGWPTVAYCRDAYWSYGPEPYWERHDNWVHGELIKLINKYVDAWNETERNRVAEINDNLLTQWEAACEEATKKKTSMPPKPKLERPHGLVDDRQASQLSKEVEKQLKAHVMGGKDTPLTGPFWLSDAPLDPDPTRIIPLQNGLLDITDPNQPVLLPHTPRYFAPYLLPFQYDPNWPRPNRFLGILEDQFGQPGDADEDTESKEAVLEFLALALIPELKYEKFLILLGESGTGRSTLLECFEEVIGERNHAAIELQALQGKHGKAGLVDKLFITFNDARSADSQDTTAVLQFLLQLVGCDKQLIEPKYRDHFTARLIARAAIICNTLPNFRDITTAMERRTIIVDFKKKISNPHSDLRKDIKQHELPGILNELLRALGRLQQRGQFVQPQAAKGRLHEMRDAASNVFGFIEEHCTQADDTEEIRTQQVYDAYCYYAHRTGTKPLGKGRFREHFKIATERMGLRVREVRPWADSSKEKRLPATIYGMSIDSEFLNDVAKFVKFG
jgi:P4 family phage/plasmid primase-like protien